MNSFQLTIRTPEKDVFSGEVSALTFDAEDGRMQVLPHHASISATLNFSPLVIKTEGKEEEFFARRGIFLFDNAKNSGVLLCLTCELKSEMDHMSARDYLNFIKEKLEKKESLSEFQVKYLEGEKLAVEKQVSLTK